VREGQRTGQEDGEVRGCDMAQPDGGNGRVGSYHESYDGLTGEPALAKLPFHQCTSLRVS
jgi:hypothetical protein